MKKIILMLFNTFLLFFANAQKQIVEDANAEVRTISGKFTSIKVSHAISLFLSQSDNEALAVSAATDKMRDAIKTEIVNETLVIYLKSGTDFTSYNNKPLRVYISFKNVESIEASGACDIQVAGVLNLPNFKIQLSGASNFKGALNTQKLNIKLNGASNVKLNGNATNTEIETTGASDVKAYKLITEYCTAKASGASDINITVNKELSINASGASEIYFKGNPIIKEVRSSSASSVGKKND